MLTVISLGDFKLFEKATIKLKNLTILTGTNSSGKSSVLQAIRLINRSCNEQKRYLDGHGELDEFVNTNSASLEPGFNVEIIDDKQQSFSLKYGYGSTLSPSNRPFPKCEYLSADRLGPRSNLQISSNPSSILGERGENILVFLAQCGQNKIDEKFHFKDTTSTILRHNLNEWVSKIFSNKIMITHETYDKHSIGYMEVDGFRATNTGFGISYTLPIIAALLGLKTIGTEILLIENPESHLHPRGQSEIAKLIAIAVTTGLQVIVETHSDHIINSIHHAILSEDYDIGRDDVVFHFFDKSQKEIHTEIVVDENGNLDPIPEGFFDQMEKDLFEIIKSKPNGK